MALRLAFVEAGLLFTGVCVLISVWAGPVFADGGLQTMLAHALAVSACCLVSFYYNDLYDLRIVRGLRDFTPRLVPALGVTLLLLAACQAIVPGIVLEAPLFVPTLAIVAGLVLPLRAVCYRFLTQAPIAQRVLVLGTGALAAKIAEALEAAPCIGYRIVGTVDERTLENAAVAPEAPNLFFAALSPSHFGPQAAKEMRPDTIVVALTERRGRLPVWGLLSSCATGVRVEDGLEFYERITQKLAIESLSPSFLIFSRTFEKSSFQLFGRRATSLAVAAVGLVLTAPLMAIVAVLIKLDSKGPVFFVQERAGRGGRIFRLIKFRTMRLSTGREENGVWQRDVSSRLTPLSRWLRKLRLDELPQFINILKGEMDLIGPRPEMACNVKTMSELIPYYPLRHTVRPGVTGWAQVRQGYALSQAEVEEKTRYDLYYIKHMSLWLDLRILVDTVKIVLFGRGAR